MTSKTVIVTGASRGLGFAIAEHIANAGHNLVLVARSEGPLAELRKQYGKQIQYIAGDLKDFAIANQAVALANSTYGRLDGLIINHGGLEPMRKIADITAEEWQDAYNSNVFSGLAFIQQAIPLLRKTRGSIVFTSSGASKKQSVAWGVYASGKAVFDHVAGTIASEESDITVLSIAPGTVDTAMQKDIRERHVKHFSESDAKRFLSLPEQGLLLRPEVPGSLMARLALNPPRSLSGKYFRWDAAELAEYRKKDD